MFLNLIYLLSALLSAGICYAAGGFHGYAWLWLLPLGFVGVFFLCLLGCFLSVWIPAKRYDPHAEVEQDDPYVRTLVKLYAPAVFRLLGCKIEVTGAEKLPKEGRFLLVCNHLQNLDPGVILAAFPNAQLAFVAKKEAADMPIVGAMIPRMLGQYLDKHNDRAALKTILKCIAILKEDKASIGIFPEGGIIKDGRLLHRFRAGAFKIAQKANVPVVVCTLNGTQNIVPNLKKLRRTHIRLHLVDVIPAAELKGVTTFDIADRVFGLMEQDFQPEEITY